jgi:hypothetical protein
MLPGGDMVAFLNDRNALCQPGTCWLDPCARRIFYLEDIEGAPVELCVNPSPLLRLTQTRYVVLESLHCAHGLASAVEAMNCSDVTIEACQAEQFSLSGFHLEGSRYTVRHCRLSDVGLAGVRLSSGDAEQLMDGNSVVEYSSFERWGQARKVYEPAVKLHGTGTLVRGCNFNDGPHMAIEVLGNSHHIDGNKFSNVVQEIDDMGAIYLNLGEEPLQRGHVVSHNLFHDIGVNRTIASAIYIDRCSMGITVLRNLFVRICGDGSRFRRAIHANGASHLAVVENLFVDCECAFELDFYLTSWGSKGDAPQMIKARELAAKRLKKGPPHITRYPELLQLAEENPTLPATNKIRGNFVLAPNAEPRSGFVISSGPLALVALEDNVVYDRQNLNRTSLLRLTSVWRWLLGNEITADDFDARIAELITDWGARQRELSDASTSGCYVLNDV